jgi:hypothetical protein
MAAAGERSTALSSALNRIVAGVAGGLTGREVRLNMGGHEVDLVIDQLDLTPAPLWNGPPGPTQTAEEVIDIAFDLGEIARRNLANPLGFSFDAAKAITGSIDRWWGLRSDLSLTDLPIAAAASVAAHKLADSSLPAARATASCSDIRLRSRSIVGGAIEITFVGVAVTGTVDSEQLVEWLRLAGLAVPAWGILSIESDEVLRFRHRRVAWLPQLVLAVGVVDGAVVVEVNHVAFAGKLLTLPESRRKKWTATASRSGLSLEVRSAFTGHDMLSIEATQDRWTRSMSLEQLQKLSLDLAEETRFLL